MSLYERACQICPHLRALALLVGEWVILALAAYGVYSVIGDLTGGW